MRLRKQEGIELLRSVWLFERCTNKELASIREIATPLDTPEGKVLAAEGETGSEFFVIVSGKAEATKHGISVGVLGPGSFFGEIALLDHRPRTATVTTIEPTSVLVITQRAFTGLVQTMPSVDRKMLVVLAERLRDVEARFVPAQERVNHPDIM